MMHMSDADAPHASSTDAPRTHKACTAAHISPPTRQMHQERASGSKGSQNGGSETAQTTADGATMHCDTTSTPGRRASRQRAPARVATARS